MKWAGTDLRFIVVRECVLLPFAIERISVESNIRMYRHPVISQHATVNPSPDLHGNRF